MLAAALEQLGGGEGDLRRAVDAARVARQQPGGVLRQEPHDVVAGVGVAHEPLAEPAHGEEPQPRVGVPGEARQEGGRAGGAVDVRGEPVRVTPPMAAVTGSSAGSPADPRQQGNRPPGQRSAAGRPTPVRAPIWSIMSGHSGNGRSWPMPG